METPLILKNLENGTITKDAALDLMLEHTSRAYAIGALLDTHRQRNDYRDQLCALQDKSRQATMDGGILMGLIDHALLTDHITPGCASELLCEAGMEVMTAGHHVETLQAEKAHNAERQNYLEFPDHAPRYCTRCGRMVKAAELSNRGICVECGRAAFEENLTGLTTKAGPAYTRWRNAILVWAYTLEDQEIAERHVEDAPEPCDLIDDIPAKIPDHAAPTHIDDAKECPSCGAYIFKDAVHCWCCDTGIHEWEAQKRNVEETAF